MGAGWRLAIEGPMKKHFNYHGYAHTLSKKDKRVKKFSKQRKVRGFDDTETWSLRDTFAAYVLPRLRRFREIEVSYPGSFESREEWNAVLDKMIFAFNLVERENQGEELTRKEWQKYAQGMNLFAKWYMALWW